MAHPARQVDGPAAANKYNSAVAQQVIVQPGAELLLQKRDARRGGQRFKPATRFSRSTFSKVSFTVSGSQCVAARSFHRRDETTVSPR